MDQIEKRVGKPKKVIEWYIMPNVKRAVSWCVVIVWMIYVSVSDCTVLKSNINTDSDGYSD